MSDTPQQKPHLIGKTIAVATVSIFFYTVLLGDHGLHVVFTGSISERVWSEWRVCIMLFLYAVICIRDFAAFVQQRKYDLGELLISFAIYGFVIIELMVFNFPYLD